MLQAINLRDVKPGEYFRLRNDVNVPIWKRQHYDRASKKYSISPTDDMNRELFRKGSLIVYI